ncbi:MAG: hypothetical protein R3C19_22520 [Planctomycetaceae bacterium]
MAEVAGSQYVSHRLRNPVSECLDGLLRCGLLPSNADVVDRWHTVLDHGYPIPTLDRDGILAESCLKELEQYGIYSRGRFGAWKYEVSNQDHSFMQGVEAVDRILFDLHGNHAHTTELRQFATESVSRQQSRAAAASGGRKTTSALSTDQRS